VYDDPLDRVWCDLDILVASADFDEAFGRLLRAGFSEVPAPPSRGRTYRRYYEWTLDGPVGIPVELHRDIAAHGLFSVDLAGFLERAVPFTMGHTPALGLAPDDLLLMLCLHIVKGHFWVQAKHFRDIALVTMRQEVDWRRFERAAIESNAPWGVYYVLSVSARRYGARIPAEALRVLAPRGVRRLWLDRSLDPERFDLARIAATPPWRLRLRYASPWIGLYEKALPLVVKYGWNRVREIIHL
jgi:hypothetical protein